MSRILARLRNIREEDIKHILKRDAHLHAKDGLQLRYLWQNEDHSAEVLFLFGDYMKQKEKERQIFSVDPDSENLDEIYNSNFTRNR